MTETCVHCGKNPRSAATYWQAARNRKGWSVREAAAAAGVSASLVSRIEAGHGVSLKAALALAAAYGESVESLSADVGHKPPDDAGARNYDFEDSSLFATQAQAVRLRFEDGWVVGSFFEHPQTKPPAQKDVTDDGP